jgi:hypothetical protein
VTGAERWWRENEIRETAGKSEIQGTHRVQVPNYTNVNVARSI